MRWQYYISFTTLWVRLQDCEWICENYERKRTCNLNRMKVYLNWKASYFSAHRDTPHLSTKTYRKAFCPSHNTEKTKNWPLQIDCRNTEDFCNAIYVFWLKRVLACFWITVAELLSSFALRASNSAIWPALRNIFVSPICKISQITKSSVNIEKHLAIKNFGHLSESKYASFFISQEWFTHHLCSQSNG